MTSHMHTPYGAPTNRLKGNPHRRYETVSIHGPVGKEHSNQFPPRIAFMPPLGFLANSCTANSCTVTVLSCTVPRTLMFEPVTNTCVFGCVVTVSSTGAKNRFKEMTTATSGILAEKMATPWLTDAGAGRRLRWSLDIVERCSVQWAEAAMVGLEEECIDSKYQSTI